MSKSLPFTFFQMHPKALLLEWQQEPNLDLLHEINCFKTNIESHFKDICQITQGYCTLLIQWKNELENLTEIKAQLETQFRNIDSAQRHKKSKHWTLPVCYEGEFALDLEELSSELNLSKEEIVSRHSQPTYNVFFIGFLPGFLYLEGLDPRLFFPRKKTPRLKISKGAIAIGGKQTGIYPSQSPGGWQIIGNTPIPLFNPDKKNPCFAASGDTLSFDPISYEEYQLILKAKNPIQYLTKKG
ncbi:MAG: 5-oxoprolinase subunit PxpB [Flavobacteriaceae bacterium]|nr:5-oxoprolinase subunit PxpB [Flavobacteriaceae bacterium]MDG1912243.1 5-oxoprolinase subunit PxpB [Flavobacteriaceae bacterium]